MFVFRWFVYLEGLVVVLGHKVTKYCLEMIGGSWVASKRQMIPMGWGMGGLGYGWVGVAFLIG